MSDQMVAAEKDGRRSWVIAVACCCCHCLLHGTTRLSGMLLVHLVRNFHVNRTMASLPFSVCNSVMFVSGPLVGLIAKRFGMRRTILIGCAMASIGIALCYFAVNIIRATIFWGLLFGLGNGLGTTLLPHVINQNFDAYLSTASGISYSGTYIGSFLLPPVVTLALDYYGFYGLFLILSGIIMQSVIAAMLFGPDTSNKKSSVEQIHREIKIRSDAPAKSNSISKIIPLVKETDLIVDTVSVCVDCSRGFVRGSTEKPLINRRMSNPTVTSSEACARLSQMLSSRLRPSKSCRKFRNFSSSDSTSSENLSDSTITNFHPNKTADHYFKAVLIPTNRAAEAIRIPTYCHHGSYPKISDDGKRKIIRTIYSQSFNNAHSSVGNVEGLLGCDTKTANPDLNALFLERPIERLSRKWRRRYTSEPLGGHLHQQCLERRTSAVYENPAFSWESDQFHTGSENTVYSEDCAKTSVRFTGLTKTMSDRFRPICRTIRGITAQDDGRTLPGATENEWGKMNGSNNLGVRMANARSSESSIPVFNDVENRAGERSPKGCFANWIGVFTCPMFIVISATHSLYFFIRVCLYTVIGDYAADIGMPDHSVHYSVMVLSSADLVGTLCFAWITDKKYLSRPHHVALCFAAMCISLTAISFAEEFVTLMVTISVYGIFESSALTMFPLLIAQYVSHEDEQVSWIASNNFLVAPTMLLVSIVIGGFRDSLGSYTGMLYLLSSLSAFSSAVWFILPRYLR